MVSTLLFVFITIRFLANAIDAPSGLHRTKLRSDSFILRWNERNDTLYKLLIRSYRKWPPPPDRPTQPPNTTYVQQPFTVRTTSDGAKIKPNMHNDYYLFAINASDSSDFKFTRSVGSIKTTSLPPYNVTISKINSTQFDVSWDHDESGQLQNTTRYEVKYTTNGGKNKTRTIKGRLSTNKTIDGLTPNTGYNVSVRVKFKRPGAFTYYSNPVKAITGQPVTLILSQPIGSSTDPSTIIKVDWNKPDGGDAIDNYTVEWKLTRASSYNSSATVAHVVGSTSYSYVINSLIPGGSYDARVRARNSAGYGLYTPSAAYVTAPGQPVTLILSQPIGSSTDPSTIIKVDWNKPDGGDAIDNYTVEWKLTKASSYNSSATVAHVVGSTSYSYVINSLIPGGSYDARVRARNSAGYGLYTPSAAYVTAPGQPVTLILSQPIGSSTDPSTIIKVDWNKPDGGDAIDNYTVEWKLTKASSYNSSTTVAHAVGSTSYSYVINSLIPGGSYDVRVRARNSAGYGLYTRSAAYVTVSTCNPVDIPVEGDINVVHFGFSTSSALTLSNESCPNSNRSLASIKCIGINPLNSNNSESSKRIKNGYDVTSLISIRCNFTIENFLSQAQLPSFTVTPDSIERTTAHLQLLTSEPTSLTARDIKSATAVLNIIEAGSVNQTIEPSTLGYILHTIDQLGVAVRNVEKDNALTQKKSNLIISLSTFVERVNPPTNNKILTLRSTDITVQISNIPRQSFKNGSNSTNYSDLVFNFDTDLRSTNDSNLVTFPSQIIQLLSQSTSQHNDQSLFVALFSNGSTLNSRENISQVITVGGRNLLQSDLSALNFSIRFKTIEIPKREIKNPVKMELRQARLVELNSKTLTWDVGHCSQDLIFNSEYKCQRLASFSILFSSRIVPSNFALSIVSYIGCGISILSLLATILIHLRYRKLREKFTTTCLVNISTCLMAVYLLFAVGVQNASNSAACDGLTFLLHYATLSCLVWMCINAGQMYRAFTKITYVKSKTKSFKIYLVAYLLPFIIVLINFSVTVLYLDTLSDRTSIYYESLYRLRHACWLKAPSFYWGFLLPAGLAILFNYVIFILLIKKLTCERVEIRSTGRKKSLKDNVIMGIVLVTMMGLTWVFGYLLMISDDVIYQSAMQWLFTLFNVFQGLAIFILNCVRRDDVRKVWLPACCVFTSKSKNQLNRKQKLNQNNTVNTAVM